MKLLPQLIGAIFMVLAGLATPISIIYCLYLWGGQDYALATAAWEAAKTWLLLMAGLIPGIIFYAVGSD